MTVSLNWQIPFRLAKRNATTLAVVAQRVIHKFSTSSFIVVFHTLCSHAKIKYPEEVHVHHLRCRVSTLKAGRMIAKYNCRKLLVEHFRFKETISFLVFVLMFSRTFQSRKRLGTRFSVVVIRRFYIFDNSVEISK